MKKTSFFRSKNLFYCLGRVDEKSLWEKEFDLSLKRTVSERVDRAFIKTYRPVMDDIPYRIFNRMQDYHQWCAQKLPSWLGYGKTK